MTLHQAIQEILMAKEGTLSSSRIAEIANSQALYRRKDGEDISPSQISARVAKYPNLFEVDKKGNITLINKGLHTYRREYLHLLDILRKSAIRTEEMRHLANLLVFVGWYLSKWQYRTPRLLEAAKEFNIGRETLAEYLIQKGFSFDFRNANSRLSEDMYAALQAEFTSEKISRDKRNDIDNSFNPKAQLNRILQQFEEITANYHLNFSTAYQIIEQLREERCHYIYQSFVIIQNAETPSEEVFGKFYSDIINEYTNLDINAGMQSTPASIAQFIGKILKLRRGGKIFDPFAGRSVSLVQLYNQNKNSDATIVGGDINANAGLLGQLNLLANGCKKFYYYKKDAFREWHSHIGADLVVTMPPFGIRKIKLTGHNDIYYNIISSIGIEPNSEMDSQMASIVLSLAHLKQTGKAVIVIPDGILFGATKNYYALRNYLVSNNLIKGIFSLPAGIFKPVANISCSVLILDKDNTSESGIYIADYSGLSSEEFAKQTDHIIENFHLREDIIDQSKTILIQEIEAHNFDLSVKRYLAEQFSGREYKRISDLGLRIMTGIVVPKGNLNREEGIPFIQIGDLPDTDGLSEIDLTVANSFITEREGLSKFPNFVSDNSVLISKVGAKLKPTLYRYKGDALCNPNIIVINTDGALVLPEYLITQLQSQYVLRQIESIRHNIGVPHFSKGDFLNVKIKLLPIEEQRKFVTQFYGKKLQEEKALTEYKREDDLYNIIASLKHELKQPISSLKMDIESLSEFLSGKIEKGEKLLWDELIVDLLPGESIENAKGSILTSVIMRMSSAVQEAHNTLGKAEEILNIGSAKLHKEKIALRSFLNDAIIPLFINENCTINLLGDEVEINADKYQLEVLFKRLIENAVKHGFNKQKEKASNIVNIKMSGKAKSSKKELNEVIVENNGSPFPEGFDIEKFQNLGHTTNRKRGTGFGGFHIKRIIEGHKGELHLAGIEEIGESEFKVRFKIYLP